MQNAVGIFVAQHQFSHLPAFQRYGWISKFWLIFEMKGLVFGYDCDANLRPSDMLESPQPPRLSIAANE